MSRPKWICIDYLDNCAVASHNPVLAQDERMSFMAWYNRQDRVTRAVLAYKSQGYTQGDISLVVGIDRRRVGDVLKMARKKYKKS